MPSAKVSPAPPSHPHPPPQGGRAVAGDRGNYTSTLAQKLWDSHVVREGADEPDLLYVDLHLIHEVTSPQAFEGLRLAGRRVRRPDLTVATMDHNVPTRGGVRAADDLSRKQMEVLAENCRREGIPLHQIGSRRQGIVHVIGPELGLTQPGMLIVCGDSHTSTHGAFGALAFGIGTSEVEMVLATQCLPQNRLRDLAVTVDGELPLGVTSKDVVLGLIGRTGISEGQGHLVEYRGSTIRGLSIEGRMTICNMSIEWGAKAGMVAPDDTTFAYLERRPHAPKGTAWETALEHWRTLQTDPDAVFEQEISIDAAQLEPHVTWGTNPGQVAPVTGRVPSPHSDTDERALRYMDLTPGTAFADITIDRVFIGSCTNARIEDLRAAARVIAGKQVHSKVRAMVVPGSTSVKRAAEDEGLDAVFKAAGFEWRNAGCSMCLGMNPDILAPGERCASTSNRNFEGRQGSGGRTHLMSPPMAAAAAITGHIVDVRELLLMEPVSKVTGRMAPLDRADVDTDQIIPKQFLKRIERTGYGPFLFFDWRANGDFVLDKPEHKGASVLLTGENFGCGSSREHAPWAIKDAGYHAIISPSFADIFRANCYKTGILAVVLPDRQVRHLIDLASEDPTTEITVDLEAQEVRGEGFTYRFEIDQFAREMLLNGIDEITLVERDAPAIGAFESKRPAWLPNSG